MFLVCLVAACDQSTGEERELEECLSALGVVDTTGEFEEQWTSLAALNTPHQYHGAVAINGMIYAVGGAQPVSREAAAFEVYDVQANTWQVLENMPTPRNFLATAEAGNSMYAIGGIGFGVPEDTSDFFLSTVEVYDVLEQRWDRRTELPTPRNRLGAVSMNGRIYVIGGLTRGGDTGIVEVYDPSTDQWDRRADMPTARHGHAIVTLHDEILVIGGYAGSAGGPVPTVEAYNPATDTWEARADMPTARGFLGAAAAKGFVYAIAGRYQRETNPVERYNPCLDEWVVLGSMPGRFRNRFATVAIDDLIYAIGGESQGDEQLSRSLERFTP